MSKTLFHVQIGDQQLVLRPGVDPYALTDLLRGAVIVEATEDDDGRVEVLRHQPSPLVRISTIATRHVLEPGAQCRATAPRPAMRDTDRAADAAYINQHIRDR